MPGRKFFGINQKQNCSKQRDQVEMERMLASRPPPPAAPQSQNPRGPDTGVWVWWEGPRCLISQGGHLGPFYWGKVPTELLKRLARLKKTFQRAIEKLVQRVFAAFGSNRENYVSEQVCDQIFYSFNES